MTKYIKAKSEGEGPCVMRLDQAKTTTDDYFKGEGYNGGGHFQNSLFTGEKDFDSALTSLKNDGDYRDAKEITKQEFDDFKPKKDNDFGFVKGGHKDE